MSKNNLQSSFIENKYHVKLYKRGKQWVAMGITLATLTGISFATSTTANAAETTTNDPTSNISQSAPTNTSGTEVVINTPAVTDNTDSSSSTPNSASQVNQSAGMNSVSSGTPIENKATAANTGSQTQSADTNATSNKDKQETVDTPTALKSPATPAPATPAPTVDSTVPATDKSGAASTDSNNIGSSSESPTAVTSDSEEKQTVTNAEKVDTTVNAPDLKTGNADNVTDSDSLQKVIVQVGDKNWTTTGESGSKINYDTTAITNLVPLGNALVGPVKDLLTAVGAPINFDADATKDQVVTLPLSTTLVTTRTIHLVNNNGKSLAPDVVQPVYWIGVPFKDNSFVVYTPISWYPNLDVPTISGYTTDTTEVPAADPMIMGTKPENPSDISIIYIGNPAIADVTIPSNQGNQTVPNVSGRVGDIFTVLVPVIDGYTADKSTVLATVNPDGSITVNDPKVNPGDAGYVTYTSNVPNLGNNSGQTGNPSDNGNSGNLDNNSQDKNVVSPTDTTTQPGTAITTPTAKPDSNNGIDTTPDVNKTKPASSSVSQSTDHGTVVANPNTSTTSFSSGTSQQLTTKVSSTVTVAGQSAASQATPNESAMNQKETNQTASGQLPQTNEQSNQTKTIGVLGLIMLSLLSLFGFRRKATDDK